jgi:hypothetical protein
MIYETLINFTVRVIFLIHKKWNMKYKILIELNKLWRFPISFQEMAKSSFIEQISRWKQTWVSCLESQSKLFYLLDRLIYQLTVWLSVWVVD